jgi:hypothetical protein
MISINIQTCLISELSEDLVMDSALYQNFVRTFMPLTPIQFHEWSQFLSQQGSGLSNSP